jgi:lipopolysaccharide-induced tumor necrosis factor-alpha factor
MAPMAEPSDGNGNVPMGMRVPLGTPMSAHDLTDAESLNKNGFYSIGANPPPAWSNHIGPVHKAPPPVATQLVVPTELSDGPVDLTCVHCQHHTRTRTKSGPSPLTWALCTCMCLCLCLPCAVVPFFMSRFNVTEHYCGNCDRLLGTYKGWKGRAAP